MKHLTLLALAALSAAALTGCNSLTEPNQYKVVKERRDNAPAPPKADNNQGSVVLNVGDANAPKAQPGQLQKPEAMKANVPAKQPQPAQPAAGSCGE